MRESTTYQAILREGRAEGLELGRAQGREEGLWIASHDLLVRLGTHRFGAPSKRVQGELKKLDLATTQRLAERVLEVESWAELLR